MRYPIYLDYSHSPDKQVGWIEIEKLVPEVVRSCAVVPGLIQHDNGDVEVIEFGLIQRTQVDTRPQEKLGER